MDRIVHNSYDIIIIKLLFPLRYPMICATLYIGGILISI